MVTVPHNARCAPAAKAGVRTAVAVAAVVVVVVVVVVAVWRVQ